MTWWRWGSVGVVVLGTMVAASVFADPHGWRHSVRWAEAREREWIDAAAECPVLFAPSVAGSSVAGCAAAARLGAACREVDARRLAELAAAGAAGIVVAGDRPMLAGLAPAVAELRAAAHRLGGGGTWPVPDLGPASTTALLDLPVVLDALRVTAHEHARAGDAGAAIDCLLDGLAVGVDLAHSMLVIEQMLGVLAVQRCVGDLGEDLLVAADETTLRRAQDALALADAALPPESPCLGDHAATMVLALVRHAQWSAADLGLPTPLLAWRQGFSVRRLGMARATQLVEAVLRFGRETPPGREPWPARRARLQQVAADIDRQTGELPFRMTDHLLQHEEQRREAVTGLRLLRRAVALHRDEVPPALADPFGHGALQRQSDGSGTTLTGCQPTLVRRVATRAR